MARRDDKQSQLPLEEPDLRQGHLGWAPVVAAEVSDETRVCVACGQVSCGCDAGQTFAWVLRERRARSERVAERAAVRRGAEAPRKGAGPRRGPRKARDRESGRLRRASEPPIAPGEAIG